MSPMYIETLYTTKWYMNKVESVRENGTHKILWEFEIQTDYLIPT